MPNIRRVPAVNILMPNKRNGDNKWICEPEKGTECIASLTASNALTYKDFAASTRHGIPTHRNRNTEEKKRKKNNLFPSARSQRQCQRKMQKNKFCDENSSRNIRAQWDISCFSFLSSSRPVSLVACKWMCGNVDAVPNDKFWGESGRERWRHKMKNIFFKKKKRIAVHQIIQHKIFFDFHLLRMKSGESGKEWECRGKGATKQFVTHFNVDELFATRNLRPRRLSSHAECWMNEMCVCLLSKWCNLFNSCVCLPF